MGLKECYESLGGDYEAVLSRLRTEERVKKFLLMFREDDSYDRLIGSLEKGDDESAFRAAHTLKGVCQNLSFTRLYRSSEALTEALRGGQSGDISNLINEVKADYERTATAIRMMEQENEAEE